MVGALIAAALVTAAPLPQPHRSPVPILMYHVISAPPPGVAYPELYVRPADFAAEMRWLARHRFQAVTLERVYDYWTLGLPLQGRPVVISFDDGYESQATQAFPAMRRYHWPGVVNLEWGHTRPRSGLPLWRLHALLAAGWELDAHTLTHPDLTTVDDSQLWREIAGSRKVMQRQLHVPVNFFCYPSGRYDARVIRAVRRAGYRGATTTNYGLAAPPGYFTLNRVRVDGSDGAVGLAKRLRSLLPP